MHHRIPSAFFAFFAAFALFAIFASAQPTIDAELEKGHQLLQQAEFFNALKQYQRANQLADAGRPRRSSGWRLPVRG